MRNNKVVLIFSALAVCQAASADYEDAPRLEEVSILGDPAETATIPGSAYLLDTEYLARFEQADIMRVLRAVPGVYVQEEDGAGLRPNIGIRGSGLDRSSRIALLEDGVLIAPAPYSAPSAYYFPTQRRMTSVEVLKGPSSVRLGPRTTGGAMNMISTPMPGRRAASADLFVGEDGFGETHAWYGDSTENVGWLVETVQQRSDGFKELDGGGDTGFDVRDYLGKLRLNSDAAADWHQGIELKIGYTRQVSNETYLGLTEADFDADPYRRYAASQLDQMRNRHNQYQATYFIEPREGAWRLEVTGYNNEFSRNWFKLDKVNGSGISGILEDPAAFGEELAIIRAESDSDDDALTLRNNNRSYYSRGLQANLGFSASLGATSHAIEAGLRVHEDEVDRFQHDDLYAMRSGDLVLTSAGAPGSQSNRISTAEVTSLFVEDRIDFGDWQLTPGVRFERIDLVRNDYATGDPDRIDGPTRVRENSVDVVIPGIGATYSLDNGLVLLAGVHRGFNPPSPGSSADEEDSTNFEVGARFGGARLDAEAIGFYNDYDNLVGTCTASTGGGCDIGDQFDGGKATVAGLELLVGYDLPRQQGASFTVPLRFAYTWTAAAEFDNSFESGFGPWHDVVAGDELPYVPEHQFQIAADVVGNRWSTGLNLDYVGETRAVAGQGSIAAADLIDAHVVVDLSGRYQLRNNIDLFARIDNVLNEDYAVARRPAGLRPGKPRTAIVGFRVGL